MDGSDTGLDGALLVGRAHIIGSTRRSSPGHFSLTYQMDVVAQLHAVGHDHRPWPHRPLRRNIPAPAVVRPRTQAVAATGRRGRAITRRTHLRHRAPARRRHDAADAAALRRISGPLGIRGVPSQQERLTRLGAADRTHGRRTRRRSRRRLRPLPRRPNRLDLTPDELTNATTKPGYQLRSEGSEACGSASPSHRYGSARWRSSS